MVSRKEVVRPLGSGSLRSPNNIPFRGIQDWRRSAYRQLGVSLGIKRIESD